MFVFLVFLTFLLYHSGGRLPLHLHLPLVTHLTFV